MNIQDPIEQIEIANAGSLPRLVRHDLPERQVVGTGVTRKQYRYELAMPMVLVIDADAGVPEDAVIEMWRDVMRDIKVDITRYSAVGRIEAKRKTYGESTDYAATVPNDSSSETGSAEKPLTGRGA